MNFYRHSIGDYRRDTHHLSLLEHGIYRQMLDQYYLDENPLNPDLDALMRSLCVRTADEQQAFQNVLKDFFKPTKNGYVHKRCEAEIQKIYDKSDKARQSAKRRWSKDNQEVTSEGNANASETHNERNAKAMLPSNPVTHKPNKNTSCDSDESAPAKPKCRFSEFWQAWPSTPRKVAKAKCLEKWKARKLDKHADAILAHIVALKATQTWRDGFEPAPLTYINQTRWEDGIPGEQDTQAPWHETRTGIIAKGQELGLKPDAFPDFQTFRTAVCRKEGIAA